jgi:hypothetical protein
MSKWSDDWGLSIWPYNRYMWVITLAYMVLTSEIKSTKMVELHYYSRYRCVSYIKLLGQLRPLYIAVMRSWRSLLVVMVWVVVVDKTNTRLIQLIVVIEKSLCMSFYSAVYNQVSTLSLSRENIVKNSRCLELVPLLMRVDPVTYGNRL